MPVWAPVCLNMTAVTSYRYGDKLKRVDSNFPDETTVIQYLYDGFGKRRDRVVNNTVTWWRYDAGWNIIAEYDDQDVDWVVENQSRTYVPGLAEIMGADAATGAYRYYYTDNLGSVRRMRDQSKASLASYEFDPYGGQYHMSGLALNRGFTGHLWDAHANMYFAPFRYYTPGNARWLTRDPIGYKDGQNVYAYVRGNPANRIDRVGLTAGACYGSVYYDFLGFGGVIGGGFVLDDYGNFGVMGYFGGGASFAYPFRGGCSITAAITTDADSSVDFFDGMGVDIGGSIGHVIGGILVDSRGKTAIYGGAQTCPANALPAGGHVFTTRAWVRTANVFKPFINAIEDTVDTLKDTLTDKMSCSGAVFGAER